MTTPFTLNNKEYKIRITHGAAWTTYPEKFDINIFELFEEGNIDSLLVRMTLGDKLALELLFHYTEEYLDRQAVIEALDKDPSALQRFKDAWWEELMRFFDPVRRQLLQEILREAPRLLKKQIKESLQENSEEKSLNSLERLESTQTHTQ